MKRDSRWLLQVAAAITLAWLVSGCVGGATGQIAMQADAYGRGTYFVERQPKDERDLATLIAERMRARGLQATAGGVGDQVPQVDYVVRYTDRWIWDMRMYLSDLRIELRDAKDQSIVGYGQSTQSSLKAMGKTHQDIVEAALDQLFPAR